MEPTRPEGEAPSPRDRPVLRLTSHVTPSEPPDARDAPYVTDRLTALSNELAALLNGSLRSLDQARRSLPPVQAGALPLATSLDAARRRLDTAHEGMERMAGLLHLAMQARSGAVPEGTGAQLELGLSLEGAVAHAVELLAPLAKELEVGISTRLDSRTGQLPIDPLYPALLAGLRNGIEAAGSLGRGGQVEIRMDLVNLDPQAWIRVEIADNGPGVPPQAAYGNAFVFGMTTKGQRAGVGLALAGDIVSKLGGTISLETAHAGASPRAGAVLRFAFPTPAAWGVSGAR